jgi:hypothetical protein
MLQRFEFRKGHLLMINLGRGSESGKSFRGESGSAGSGSSFHPGKKPASGTLRRCAPLPIVIMLVVSIAMAGCALTSGPKTSEFAPTPTVSISLAQQNLPPNLLVGGTAIVSATVSNDVANAGVDWVAMCGSPPTCGTFSPAHTASGATTNYTAPLILPTGGTVTVTALSTTDHSKASAATITIVSTITGVKFTLSPPSSYPAGGVLNVAAVVAGDPSNSGVNWTATCGTLNCTTGFGPFVHTLPTAPTATFTVPAPSATFPAIVGSIVTITAFAAADHNISATATIAVTSAVALNVTQAPPSTLFNNASASVIAVVTNDTTNSGVTWTILGCDNTPCGSWSANSAVSSTNVASGATATYYSPAPLPPPAQVNHVMLQAAATVASAPSGPTSAFMNFEVTINPPVSISISQGIPHDEIVVNTSAPLIATVTNDLNALGVDWTVTCSSAGACGSFSLAHTDSGAPTTYTAPSAVPTANTVTITATSTADNTKTANNIVTIEASIPPDTLLSGTWIMLLTGRDANGGPYVLGGGMTGDGLGNITGGLMDLVDTGGGGSAALVGLKASPAISSYSIGLDGRGQIQLTLDTSGLNGPFGVQPTGAIVLSVVFVNSNHALVSETDSFGTGTGTLDLQNASDFASFQNGTSGPNGIYSLSLTGAEAVSPYPKFYVAGALGLQSSGTKYTETSYVADQSDKGVVTEITPHAVSHVFGNPVPSAFGKMVLDSVSLGLPRTFNLDAWMIDANHFVVTDTSDVFSGTPLVFIGGYMVAQPASPTVSGTYVFVENGVAASPSFTPFAAGAVITCNTMANPNGSGTFDFSSLGGTPLTDVAINVACNPPVSGRGKFGLINTSTTHITRFSAYQTVDGGSFAMELDGGSAGTSGPSGMGMIMPQTLTPPIAASSFSGKYASNFLANTSQGFEAFAGQIDSDGAMTLSGTADVNSFSDLPPTMPFVAATPSSGAALGGSFAVDGTGGKFPLKLTITPATGQPTPEIPALNPACYIVDANTCLLIGLDATAPGTGILELQNTGLN